MNKYDLTKKQEKVFKLVTDYFDKNGQAPTILELKKLMNVRSLRTVTQYLEILEKKGYICREKYAKRGTRLIGKKAYFNPEMINIQVFGSAGCDNQSILAEPMHDEFISVSRDFLGDRGNRLIAIRAIGRSMLEAGINDGDTVLVEKTNEIKNNDRVVAIIDDIAVIKRISFTENAIILNPDSKDESYKPIVMKKDFKVFGKVIDVIKKPGDNDEIEIIPIKNY